MNADAIAFRPPAPLPREKPLGVLGRIAALRRNPIEIWTRAHYERPVMVGRTVFGHRAVVSDPAGVRRVFLDNVANYRKDDLQLRILRPGLGNGLLTADGEEWRAQRRSLASLFTPRQVTAFAGAMAEATRAGVERLGARDNQRIDMSRRDGAPDAGNPRAHAVLVRPRPQCRRVPAGGDALFRHHRPRRICST